MEKLKCYYAHCMLTYDSSIEQQDIKLLEKIGVDIINPNCEEHRNGCTKFAFKYGKDKVMKYFENIVEDCDMIAFRALPDGQIPSGVAVEVLYAKELNLPIIELPCSITKRCQAYPETKEYLTEIGLYKIKE